jgi:malonyl-CoA O-methyltransferase
MLSTIARRFNRIANIYNTVAVLQQEVGSRLVERLEDVTPAPQLIIDAGTGTGNLVELLAKKFPSSHILAVDAAQNMLKQTKKYSKSFFPLCADVLQLPLSDHCVDIIISNFMLEWCDEVVKVFQEFKRVLKPNGLLLFSTLGPDTFKELRESWAQVDVHTHVHSFLDMHDVGDILIEKKFTDPVVDVERFTFTYKTSDQLLRELRAMGIFNFHPDRSKNLISKSYFKRFLNEYEKLRGSDGKLPLTWEVIYGRAFAPPFMASDSAEVRISVSQIKRKLIEKEI